jgi:hypothetical protein
MICALAITLASACSARAAAPAPEPRDSLAAAYAAAVVRWIHPEGLGSATLCARITIGGTPMQDEKRIAQAFAPLVARTLPWDRCLRSQLPEKDSAGREVPSPALLTVDETLGPEGAALDVSMGDSGGGSRYRCLVFNDRPSPRATCLLIGLYMS